MIALTWTTPEEPRINSGDFDDRQEAATPNGGRWVIYAGEGVYYLMYAPADGTRPKDGGKYQNRINAQQTAERATNDPENRKAMIE